MNQLVLTDTLVNAHFGLNRIALDMARVDAFEPVISPLVCAAGQANTFKDGILVGVVERDTDDPNRFTGFLDVFRKTPEGFVTVKGEATHPQATPERARIEIRLMIHRLFRVHTRLSTQGALQFRNA